jgi:PAS domain S-box-containing protein
MNESSGDQPATILIVDDDALVRRSLQTILEHQGYTCRTAANGVEGLAILRAEDHDVALIDMHMPELDGLGLLAGMREANIQAVPLVLTGFGEVSSAVEAMKLGAFDYLSKPPNYQELTRATARAVEHSRARRHARIMEDLAAQWEVTFDACPDLLAILDPKLRILRCNLALADRCGVTKAELVGRGFSMLFADIPDLNTLLTRTLTEGGIHSLESPCDSLHGVFIIKLAPLRKDAGQIFGAVCVAQDITERKQAEEARSLLLTREQAARVESDRLLLETQKRERELRSLAFELSSTEDRERRKLALSIHDSLGQLLSVVKLKLTGLQREVEGHAVLAPDLAEVLRLIDQLIQQARDLTFDLYPAMLDDLGLVPTLQWYQDQFSRQTGIRVEVSEFGQTLAVPTPVQTYLFRAVKELLHNVAKHARAKEVVLNVRWQPQNLRIMVADDGCGMDASQLTDHQPPRGGLGLVGIRERIATMGGEFVFESWPGRGTQVLLEVPLNSP